ncbi:MAG: hypothetical protein IT195_02665 [Microthrixaceae bacterium]|nr:hypothetical protein [Microthrixaceae bacterium]
MGRRTILFAVAAVLAAAMIPVAEEHLVYVPIAVSITYAVLFVVSGVESLAHRRR